MIGVIPARYASSRLPGKPLLPILGKPLLQRTYENALRCPKLNRVVILTDHDEILQLAHTLGAEVVLTPTHCTSGSDRIAHWLQHSPELQHDAVIVNIQGDEPTVPHEGISKAIDLLAQYPEAAMSTLATPLRSTNRCTDRNVVKCVMDQKGFALYFSRAPIPGSKTPSPIGPEQAMTYQHIGLYAYSPSFLLKFLALPQTPLQLCEDLEQLKAMEHGYKIIVGTVGHTGPGIDTPEDIQHLERWLWQQNTSL